MKDYFELSVHQLVDFLLRSGDIDNRVFNKETMNEGSRIHSLYQSQQSKTYSSEVELEHLFILDEVGVKLHGRADGLYKKNNKYYIEEIKSTISPLEDFYNENHLWHEGQAKCYALMFALANNLDAIGIKLTYIRQGKEKEKKSFEQDYSIDELNNFVEELLEKYLQFYYLVSIRIKNRNNTIKDLNFPYDKYRKGQRELAKYCYAVCKKGGNLFVEAPTGIGKTMSTLFPYIKAMAEEENSKIFYLTAKTSGKESAYNAIQVMKKHKLSISDIVITAKDKICFCDKKSCNPEDCPYARGYYTKIQNILRKSLIKDKSYDLETIKKIALENEVCPFELQLDLSLFCDVIICDYNYVFDPISYMKRYFDEDSSHDYLLIDEAHNMVERSKGMYSMILSSYEFDQVRKLYSHVKHPKIKRALSRLNKVFTYYKNLYNEDGNYQIDGLNIENLKDIHYFLETIQDVNRNEHKEVCPELMSYYLDVNRLIRLIEYEDDRFIYHIDINKKNIKICFTCLDASKLIKQKLDSVKCSTFFSGTLSPIDFYINSLGGDANIDSKIVLSSPFPKENLKVIVAPKVSIKYKDRASSYLEVVKYIKELIKNKVGNYFVYCPSYEYLNEITKLLNLEDVDLYIQSKDMSDEEKVIFLDNFKENPLKTCVGLLVMGGAFSEGIDLVSDRLIGVIIIGIGLPKINFVSDMVSTYYDSIGLKGRDYAYIYPGMNKVMQAAGRVIRSENDRGVVLLIDDRYLYKQYQDLYRVEWKNYEVALTPSDVSQITTNFFNK